MYFIQYILGEIRAIQQCHLISEQEVTSDGKLVVYWLADLNCL